MGNRQWAMGNRQSAMGNGQSAIGNRQSAMGNRKSTKLVFDYYFFIFIKIKFTQHEKIN
jgi:hypothetical protein